MVSNVIELRDYYGVRRKEIKKRLKEFVKKDRGSDRMVFAELCFCICTPQSNAVRCDEAISKLEKNGLLYFGNANQIRRGLRGVRFHNNKARYIVNARTLFTKIGIKKKLDTFDSNKEARDWLVKNVKGLGYKEASHFLRNIGRGRGLAILDRHILKNLCHLGVVGGIPKSISKSRYLAIEKKVLQFSKKIKIPVEDLDLLLWSLETGTIFK